MNKKWMIFGILYVTCTVGIISIFFFYVIYTAPRMQHQVKIDDYTAIMPKAISGSIQANIDIDKSEVSDLNDNGENFRKGRILYGYYCIFCHGQKGMGDGPVGESYEIAPSNLNGDRIKKLSYLEIADRMVKGLGHEPVLSQVVDEKSRRFISLYIKNFSRDNVR
ncbi:MAG: hypothetical protein HQK54_06660 [Oligoflexales bacterium]|nr:hypothetical protein [Oligoflexales bacterium]